VPSKTRWFNKAYSSRGVMRSTKPIAARPKAISQMAFSKYDLLAVPVVDR
jgi:hypothetical protein